MGPPSPVSAAQAGALFEAACRTVAARRTPMNTPMFGAVAAEDFVRFMELHTRHHTRQIA
jgi:hypothetical protein